MSDSPQYHDEMQISNLFFKYEKHRKTAILLLRHRSGQENYRSMLEGGSFFTYQMYLNLKSCLPKELADMIYFKPTDMMAGLGD